MELRWFKSSVFPVEEIDLAGTKELIVRGGRDKFPLLKKALAGVEQIGVIGWGSQGPAQAQNLRDSLEGTGIKVKVGLREGSDSVVKANRVGFSEENGSLGEMFQVIYESDLVLLLISDAAQVENCGEIFKAMKPGATLGLSHGFLIGFLRSIGETCPAPVGVNTIGVCPKGMGPSVRRLYEQGREINGAGINCSFAVEQDLDGRVTDLALGWAVAIGAPYVFQTTLLDEVRSDLVGERAVLLGAVHGIIEALDRYFISTGSSEEAAYLQAVEMVTGPLSSIISQKGILAVSERFNDTSRDLFTRAYTAAYGPFVALIEEIYDEVWSGNEIRSVVMAGQRLDRFPMGKIDGTSMWQAGERVRAQRVNRHQDLLINPITAGLYCAAMMAQIDVFLRRGHRLSEIANESVIEAVDSLNPFMHHKGVAFMVDNCSTTARLGARKWAPRWDYVTMQQVLVDYDRGKPVDWKLIEAFQRHPIHQALKVCASLRPPVDIAVVG